jgi:hypothetical protein
MTSPRRSRRFDRRKATRRMQRISALVGTKHDPPENCENAVVEEIGRGGLRIRSGANLNPEDSLILYVGPEEKPVRAKVRWARKQGVIEKRRTGKPGQAVVAGLVIQERAAQPKRKERAAAKRRPGADPTAIVMRVLFAAGALGLVGLLAYAVVSLANMMG